jgi:hypothetical protein
MGGWLNSQNAADREFISMNREDAFDRGQGAAIRLAPLHAIDILGKRGKGVRDARHDPAPHSSGG